MSNKAIFIKEQISSTGAVQRVYRLDPPAVHEDYMDEDVTNEHEYVLVSAISVPFSGPETFIFPSDADGYSFAGSELDGSYRGGLDHEHALRGLGYEVDE